MAFELCLLKKLKDLELEENPLSDGKIKKMLQKPSSFVKEITAYLKKQGKSAPKKKQAKKKEESESEEEEEAPKAAAAAPAAPVAAAAVAAAAPPPAKEEEENRREINRSAVSALRVLRRLTAERILRGPLAPIRGHYSDCAFTTSTACAVRRKGESKKQKLEREKAERKAAEVRLLCTVKPLASQDSLSAYRCTTRRAQSHVTC